MKIKTITAAALAAAALLTPAIAEAAPGIVCSHGNEAVGFKPATCTALDRRMARRLAVKVSDRLDLDPPRVVYCGTGSAPRIWRCTLEMTGGEDVTQAAATIRRSGGVRVLGVYS